MFQWLKKKNTFDESKVKPLTVDVHSHLLPGIDDGAKNLQESISMLQSFEQMGFRKMVLTPHIMKDAFPNTPDTIKKAMGLLQEEADKLDIQVELEAAAEYYMDEFFMELLKSDQELMTFGKQKFLLFEMSFMNQSHFLEQAIFYIQTRKYTPILAHPERYLYLESNYNYLKELSQMGVHLQLNALSLTGYYSPVAKKLAEKLIDDEIVSFIGSDCHKLKQAQRLQIALSENVYLKKALSQPLLNFEL